MTGHSPSVSLALLELLKGKKASLPAHHVERDSTPIAAGQVSAYLALQAFSVLFVQVTLKSAMTEHTLRKRPLRV